MSIPRRLEFDGHNTGRSFYDGFGLMDEYGSPADIHIEIYDDADRENKRALALRLVACWNACEGLSIEEIADFARRARLKKRQRDIEGEGETEAETHAGGFLRVK